MLLIELISIHVVVNLITTLFTWLLLLRTSSILYPRINKIIMRAMLKRFLFFFFLPLITLL